MLATPDDLLGTKRVRPRGAKILLIVGLILLLIGVFAARHGLDTFHDGVTRIRNQGTTVRNSVLATVKVPGSGTVDLEPGKYDVFAMSDYGGFRGPRTSTTTSTSSTTSTTVVGSPPVTDGGGAGGSGGSGGSGSGSRAPVGIQEPEVRLFAPDGRELLAQEPGIGSVFGAATGEMFAVESFWVTEAGSHRLEAKGGNAARVGIAPSLKDDEVTGLVATGLGIGLAFLSGGLGVLLLIIGGVWWSVGGKPKPAPVLVGPPGPGWGGPPPPYGGWPPPGTPPPSPGWTPPAPGGWTPVAPPPPPPAPPWGAAPPSSPPPPAQPPGSIPGEHR